MPVKKTKQDWDLVSMATDNNWSICGNEKNREAKTGHN